MKIVFQVEWLWIWNLKLPSAITVVITRFWSQPLTVLRNYRGSWQMRAEISDALKFVNHEIASDYNLSFGGSLIYYYTWASCARSV